VTKKNKTFFKSLNNLTKKEYIIKGIKFYLFYINWITSCCSSTNQSYFSYITIYKKLFSICFSKLNFFKTFL